MRRGITSTIIFTLPPEAAVADLVDARISVGQNEKELFSHPLSDMIADSNGNTLSLDLTQEETLLLNPKYSAELQLKVKFIGGAVLATPIYRTSVRKILNEEAI